MGDNRRAFRSIRDVAGDIGARDGDARRAQLHISARVIRMHVRVDDVLQRLAGSQLVDGVDHLVGGLRQPGIHDQHAHVANLHGDVAARAHQHVDVALHRKNVNFAVGRIRVLRHVFEVHGREPRPSGTRSWEWEAGS